MSQSRTIYKYDLTAARRRPDDAMICLMPGSGKILSVAFQRNSLCLWAVVSPWVEPKERYFRVVGTGHDLPVDVGMGRSEFIGTAMTDDGSFVFHVFEIERQL